VTDALDRLAPVAMALLRDVDAALATLGAPASHRVWSLLGSVGTTPADLVAFVAELEPRRLRAAGQALREQERTYGQQLIPGDPSWEGAAAWRYTTTAAALRDHLGDGLAGRLNATASYVESVADWQQGLRDALARALAAVIMSSEAVALRTYRAQADHAALTAAVAAAEIGAVLLRVAQDAAASGHTLIGASSGLSELAYRPRTDDDPGGPDSPIHLS
jgi:hypothetical protein